MGKERRKIFLVGFMGSGKSTVGKILAKKLRVPFVDLDEEIEIREGLKIPQIFALKGEEYFRKQELEVLKDITYSLPSFVMATGGGVGANPAAMDFMKRHGKVVWLKVDYETFKRRTSNDENRPLLRLSEEQLKKLFQEREKIYSLADCKVESKHSPEETAKHILSCL